MDQQLIMVDLSKRHNNAVHLTDNFLRAGDGFYCPRCKCWSILLKSNDHVIFDGIPVAFAGDLFSCGASLQQQQQQQNVVGDAGGAPCPTAFRAKQSQLYSGQYQLLNDVDGKPLANKKYVIELASGEKISGTTDESGHTQKLKDSEHAENLTIKLDDEPENGY
ncbi:PAAR domain-containing protein [Acinetobacter stercoris]|uniref:PAAR domain-containing protein n=1 Tax=Acinetobacter stercoris TaxID=2126983 RepID=A0A2U3MWQ1_9GAMM|nr:PAAR domain-containing protein [Acinetobacter stercoris]SPL69729.1 hypothetical protein KPC_0907 [Acinetobacter stercoris]